MEKRPSIKERKIIVRNRLIQDNIFNAYPSGLEYLGYHSFAALSYLWKMLSDDYSPKDVDIEAELYKANIKATKQKLTLYKKALANLYHRLSILIRMVRTETTEITTKHTNRKINNLSILINKTKQNIKKSEYGLIQTRGAK